MFFFFSPRGCEASGNMGSLDLLLVPLMVPNMLKEDVPYKVYKVVRIRTVFRLYCYTFVYSFHE